MSRELQRAARRWAEGSRRDLGGQPGHHRVLAMAEIVLRVRLTGGDHMDVTDEESDTVNAAEVVEHVVSTLARDSGCFAPDTVTGSYCRTAGALPRLRWRRAARSCERRRRCRI